MLNQLPDSSDSQLRQTPPPAAGPSNLSFDRDLFFKPGIQVPFVASNGASMSPPGHRKTQKSVQVFPGELSREALETQSGKSCLPEPPRVSLICLPYSKYHGFLTSQGVPPGFLWAPFWLHFGSLLGTFGFQKSPKVRKIYFPKNIKN